MTSDSWRIEQKRQEAHARAAMQREPGGNVAEDHAKGDADGNRAMRPPRKTVMELAMQDAQQQQTKRTGKPEHSSGPDLSTEEAVSDWAGGLPLDDLGMIIATATPIYERRKAAAEIKARHEDDLRRRIAKVHRTMHGMADDDYAIYKDLCDGAGVVPLDEDGLIEALILADASDEPEPGPKPKPKLDLTPDPQRMDKYRWQIFGRTYHWTGRGRKPNALRCWLAEDLGRKLEHCLLPESEWTPALPTTEMRRQAMAIPDSCRGEAEQLLITYQRRRSNLD